MGQARNSQSTHEALRSRPSRPALSTDGSSLFELNLQLSIVYFRPVEPAGLQRWSSGSDGANAARFLN